jgi:hypothetical protein
LMSQKMEIVCLTLARNPSNFSDIVQNNAPA